MRSALADAVPTFKYTPLPTLLVFCNLRFGAVKVPLQYKLNVLEHVEAQQPVALFTIRSNLPTALFVSLTE